MGIQGILASLSGWRYRAEMIRHVHRARFVLIDPDLVLQDAAVHVGEPGRICRVEPWQGTQAIQGMEVTDWGSAALLPGLVNAHTHLELTRLQSQVSGTRSFTGWLAEVVQRRREWKPEDFAESARQGARMALESGTTLVGDISASGLSRAALIGSGLRAIVYEEVLGLAPELAGNALQDLEHRVSRANSDPLLAGGVSPHAPYSVSPQLYRGVAELARRKEVPLATHLAESKAELQLLASGDGEFRDFLARMDVLPPGWRAPGQSPVHYLESLGVLESAPLLVHCNYIDKESVARILGGRCGVAFCPRSHAFFGHERHPVRELLDAGINVALGTDSLASNHSLSMLDEMRFLRRSRADLRSEEILRMATINGAAALGFGGTLGRLRRGFWADMAVLSLPDNTSGKFLTNQILEGTGDCVATIVRGELAWKKLER